MSNLVATFYAECGLGAACSLQEQMLVVSRRALQRQIQCITNRPNQDNTNRRENLINMG
jgi:hypothetical protein